MLDKSIPYYEMIMFSSGWDPARATPPPPDYIIRPYQDGDEAHWAAIEASVGEFDHEADALAYWEREFRPHLDMVRRRSLFAIGPTGEYLGTCTAWEQYDPIPLFLIHWVAVRPQAQGLGLGGALVCWAMELFRQAGTFPVTLHTQTWSHKAIRLYHKLGFRPVRSGPACLGRNDYPQAMEVLRQVYTPRQWAALEQSAIDIP